MERLLSLLLAMLLSGFTSHFGSPAVPDTPAEVPTNLVLRVEEDCKAISASPDGQAELCVSMDTDSLFIRRDGTILPVYATESRGVPDTNGNLAKIAAMGVDAIGNEGVVWSPDGNYIAIVNQKRVAVQLQFIFDPLVIDTRTGEMFLLATYGNRYNKEGSATVVTACFSADSRYLYAVLLGSLGEDRFSLVQYDLNTLAATSLHIWEGQVYWPHLAQLREGSFLMLKEQTKSNEAAGMIRISQGVNGYEHEVTKFTQRRNFFYPRALLYSAVSGHALILSNATEGDHIFSSMLHLRPDESLAAPELYWAIPSLKAKAVAELVKNELQSPSKVIIHGARLSPDGQYALILCSEGGEFALRMLTLADGTLRPVTGVDSVVLSRMIFNGSPYIDWSGNTVYLGITAQTAFAYTLE